MKHSQTKRSAFNVIDAAILLILLLLLLTTVFFLFFADRFDVGVDSGRETVSYTVEIVGIDKALLNDAGKPPIAVGELFNHTDGAFTLGKVIAIGNPVPLSVKTSVTDQDGKIVYADHPTLVTFTVTVEAIAEKVGDGYEVGGHMIRVGDEFVMTTPYFTADVAVKTVQEVKDRDGE